MSQLFAKAYQVHIAASRVVCLSLSVPVGFTVLARRTAKKRAPGRPGLRIAD